MSNKKYGDILKELRLRIVNGHFSPGEPIPTRSELQREFDTSNQTIQMAMNSLKADGFIVTSGSGGTFVADNPPHLFHYGMVSPIRFTDTRYLTAMQHAAENIAKDGLCKFSYYYYEQAHIQTEGYKRLIADVEAHRLAGLIFPFPAYRLEETAVLKQAGLPRVINSTWENTEIPQIAFRNTNFLEKAVDYLVAQGRKRIAVIRDYLHREEMDNDIDYLAKRGVGNPALMQNCSATHAWSAHQAALLLMRLPKSERPDGLIIGDDNLVEFATEGLSKSGLRIPQELTVVAHCNFPDRPVSCVPVTRLGLDCLDLIRRDIECLEAQRNGKKVSKFTEVPAVFESELSTDSSRQPALRSLGVVGSSVVGRQSLIAGRRVLVAS